MVQLFDRRNLQKPGPSYKHFYIYNGLVYIIYIYMYDRDVTSPSNLIICLVCCSVILQFIVILLLPFLVIPDFSFTVSSLCRRVKFTVKAIGLKNVELSSFYLNIYQLFSIYFASIHCILCSSRLSSMYASRFVVFLSDALN